MTKKAPTGNQVAELLGTRDPREQAGRIRQLGAPVVDLVIRFDGRTQKVDFTVLGGQIPPTLAYRLLDACRDLIRQEELRMVAGQPAPESLPPPEGETMTEG